MPRDRDNQKERVYRAERAAFGLWDEDNATLVDLRDAQQYANKVTRSRFWKAMGGPPFVRVMDGRSRRRAGMVGKTAIAMPRWTRQEAMVLHELTHVLLTHIDRKVAAHGEQFVLVLRRLVENELGEEMRKRFDFFLEVNNVKWGIGDSDRLKKRLEVSP